MKVLVLVATLTVLPLFVFAHIGSPGVTFEGKAGAYAVMVLINPPDVIPGTATIDIFTESGDIGSIWAKPVYWFAGGKGTPSADEMIPVPGEPGHYKGIIWLMNPGTSAIEIEIKGKQDGGIVVVPVMAVSTVQKTMDSSLEWLLLGLCLLLVILMMTIIGSSVSDSLVRPNAADAKNIKRKKLTGVVVSGVILVLLLFGGKTWWDSWANDYQRFMYRPYKATSNVIRRGNGRELIFSLDTTRLTNLTFTRDISYIVPDHGKLMHMFIVRSGTMDVFAHLHPKRRDSLTFVTPLPPLPAGTYLAFADVTRLSGFSETIPDTFDITDAGVMAFASLDSMSMDPDDTYFFTNPVVNASKTVLPENKVMICGKPGIKLPLPDGSAITWEHDVNTDLLANTLYSLKFNVQDAEGKPALLQPYLGMAGHAVIMKDDGTVYIHLHPVGSYSMASQQTMLERFENDTGPVKLEKVQRSVAFRDSVDLVLSKLDALPIAVRDSLLMGKMDHQQFDPQHPEHSMVSFPYSFPSAGHYRIWIQMKRNGKILNSAFDADVK